MENNNVILVVDDDTNILAIIEMYLKKGRLYRGHLYPRGYSDRRIPQR